MKNEKYQALRIEIIYCHEDIVTASDSVFTEDNDKDNFFDFG